MSDFASHAASASEAHETHFGDTITVTPPVGSPFTIPATIHAKKLVEKPTSFGITHVTTRRVILTKERAATVKQSSTVVVESETYTIESIDTSGTKRIALNLQLIASEEVSRPAYRGGR